MLLIKNLVKRSNSGLAFGSEFRSNVQMSKENFDFCHNSSFWQKTENHLLFLFHYVSDMHCFLWTRFHVEGGSVKMLEVAYTLPSYLIFSGLRQTLTSL